jgi:chromosome segregation ATPase
MSEEEENINLEGLPTENEVSGPELGAGPSDEPISPVTEEGGIEEATTEEAMRPSEPYETATIEQPQIERKPKKPATKTTITKIQSSIADATRQIEKQSAQINKINQNLQIVQKQLRAGEKQPAITNQIRSQVNQIQKQISQVNKNVQKKSTSKLQSAKKKSGNKKKSKKKNKK